MIVATDEHLARLEQRAELHATAAVLGGLSHPEVAKATSAKYEEAAAALSAGFERAPADKRQALQQALDEAKRQEKAEAVVARAQGAIKQGNNELAAEGFAEAFRLAPTHERHGSPPPDPWRCSSAITTPRISCSSSVPRFHCCPQRSRETV
ncbi:MAG TPA: hypothetical protein VGR35_11420 [Tepidisphaeraceae bacterium]|nr:hypothetical protein [Tepidisphaeraceae bacterium]